MATVAETEDATLQPRNVFVIQDSTVQIANVSIETATLIPFIRCTGKRNLKPSFGQLIIKSLLGLVIRSKKLAAVGLIVSVYVTTGYS